MNLLILQAATDAPAPVATLLAALAGGDLPAARATLSDDVIILRGIERGAATSLEAFASHLRGCTRTGLYSDQDSEDRTRFAVTLSWTCPPRGNAQAYIWTAGGRVVHIQYE